jgi:protein ImuA
MADRMPALLQSDPAFLSALHAGVWHADALATFPQHTLPTGHALLDAQLPGGGWPVGGIVEVLQGVGAQNEWRLLLPALIRCGDGAIVLVGPEHTPFAPALSAQGLSSHRLLHFKASSMVQRLWSAEQALRCADVDAVLLWTCPSGNPDVRTDQLRRLQMAASEHHKCMFVFRPERYRNEASPAVLRLELAGMTGSDQLSVRMIKRRGPPLATPLSLNARGLPLQLVQALGA